MSKLTSLSEIANLADKAWINGSFKAIVTRAKAGSGKVPGRAVLVDPDNAAITAESCWWGGRDPSPFEGKIVNFAGAGMSKSTYKEKLQINVNEKAKVDVFQDAIPGQHMPHKAPAVAASVKPAVAGDFSEEMTKIGQTWLHSLKTALIVKELASLSLQHDLTDDQFQALVSSIFIEANRKGLGVNPPPLSPRENSAPSHAPAPEDPY